MTKAATFTKAQIVRAIQSVEAAGVVVGAVEIASNGTIKIHPKDEAPQPVAKGPEPWD